MTRAESDAFLQRNPCCVVCGMRAWEPHHRIPVSMRRKGTMPKDWNPDEPGNRVAICRACHDTYNGMRGPGQMPYMGHDRRKNVALAERVDWLLSQEAAFVAMVPQYALEVFYRWRDGTL